MWNRFSLLPVLGVVFLAACDQRAPDSATHRADPAAPSVGANTAPLAVASPVDPVANAWIGRWNGPEGTYLEIASSGPAYQIHIRNLDGVRTFEGVASGSTLGFVRDGANEIIKAGSGADTGMKWLADKADCLVVKPGEGYCRD